MGCYVAICVLSAVVTLITTPVIKVIAVEFERLDMPSGRKMHCQPMVRLGGISIFTATLFSLLCFWPSGLLAQYLREDLPTLKLLLLGGSGFFLVGLLDDLFELSAFNRLWMQGAISTVLWALGIRIDTLVVPGFTPIYLGFLGLFVTTVWFVGVVNAINWLDGLDGLAAGAASIATIVLVVIGAAQAQPLPVLLGMALLGSLLGFLCYNNHPATIFMGDGGSYFIGFILASLCVVGPYQLESPFSTLLPLLILAVPLGDMTSVILARLYRRKSPFCADNRHLHHRLLQQDFSHGTTVLIVYCLTVATGIVAFILAEASHEYAFGLGLLALMSFLLWQIWHVLKMSSGGSDVVMRKEIWYSENL